MQSSNDRAQPAALAPPCIGRAQLVQHRDGGGQVEAWHERRDALHPARRGWHTGSLRALHGVPGRQAGRTDRCRESWGERGDTGTAGRGEGPMGELGAKGDRGAMVGDGAKVYVVLTLGLPVPTSTESESGAAAAKRGDASRIACARPRPRGWVSLCSRQRGPVYQGSPRALYYTIRQAAQRRRQPGKSRPPRAARRSAWPLQVAAPPTLRSPAPASTSEGKTCPTWCQS